MNAEELADEIGETCINWYGDGGFQFLTVKAEKLIAATLEAATKAERERCAAAVCVYCAYANKRNAFGEIYEPAHAIGNTWWHNRRGDKHIEKCLFEKAFAVVLAPTTSQESSGQ